MKRTRNCLRNNLYFLGKVVQIAPLYLFLSAALRVMMGVRTSYMNVYFLAYVISCVEEGKPLIHVLLFIAVSFGAVSISYGLQAALRIFINLCPWKGSSRSSSTPSSRRPG